MPQNSKVFGILFTLIFLHWHSYYFDIFSCLFCFKSLKLLKLKKTFFFLSNVHECFMKNMKYLVHQKMESWLVPKSQYELVWVICLYVISFFWKCLLLLFFLYTTFAKKWIMLFKTNLKILYKFIFSSKLLTIIGGNG
jgi:hypothetical protein